MKRILWHKVDPSADCPDGMDWHQVELHATDAAHALAVDPDHWKADDPRVAAEVEMQPVEDHMVAGDEEASA